MNIQAISKFNYWVLIILTSASLTGCKAKVIVNKPVESYNLKTSFVKELSIINVPIAIPVSELDRQINKYMSGVLYEDRSFTNNDGDNLMCVVKKYADFKFDAVGNKISLSMPLDIKGSYTKLGAVVNFKGVLRAKYTTAITLEDNWRLKTVTKSNGYEWIKAPEVDLGWVEIPVTWIVDAIVERQNAAIDKSIDDAIKEYVKLKEIMQPAVDALADPINVSETYKTWFKISPQEILATQIYTKEKVLRFTVGMKAYTETFVGAKPDAEDVSKGLPMKVVKELPKDFNMGVVTVMSYADASEILTQEFVASGYEYVEGKYKLKFTKMNLFGQGDKMVIEVGLLGSVNGIVYLVGVPYYDPVSRLIKFKDLEFDIDSKQKLLKAANWLAHDKICRIMQDNMVFPIGEELDFAKKEAQTYLTNYEPMKGVIVNGDLAKLEASDVYLIKDAIVTVFSVNGSLNVLIKDFE